DSSKSRRRFQSSIERLRAWRSSGRAANDPRRKSERPAPVGSQERPRARLYMPHPRLFSARSLTTPVIVVAAFLIALVCALAAISKISVLPPKLEPRDFQTAGGVTHMMVDLDRSGI